MTTRIFAIPTDLTLACLVLAAISTPPALAQSEKSEDVPVETGLEFINTSFEIASPLSWETDPEGVIHLYMIYDQERSSTNRANGHWHFQLQAKQGSELTLRLHNFDNVWNGRHGSPLNDEVTSFVSHDGKDWTPIQTEKIDDNSLEIKIQMEQESLYVARLEPYRTSDLERLKTEIRDNPLVEIIPIGRTVQNRELEIIRVGRPDVPNRVLLRARSHPWEPGGNWVLQGMIRHLLGDDEHLPSYLDTYCIYVMPMANKDGVALGHTRFNLLGADLNRKWDKPADPRYSPENHALERWIEAMIAEGKRPHLAIDFHNDNSGRLHISRPNIDLEEYLERMKKFEQLLIQHSWFTEGSTGGNFHNPGTIGEGLLERYGITACVQELNANRIAGLDDVARAQHWELFGRQLCKVFYEYFRAAP
jgi:hypothetical protein